MRSLCRMVALCIALPCLLAATPATAKTLVVKPGQSIRAALAQAQPGDKVLVLPGVYHEGSAGDLNALTLGKDGIELVGVSTPQHPVVLENAGGQSYGLWVSPPDSSGLPAQEDPEHPPCGLLDTRIHGFSLTGFTVRGFADHGVHLACVDGFTLTKNLADGNGEYGLFPIASNHGSITHNEVINTQTDAGIYVGQSENVEVRFNHVHDNLLGIEIENSLHCSVMDNLVHDNSFGIFVDLLPFLETHVQDDTVIGGNQVYNNNRPNTADPEDLLGLLPPGIGVLLTGADHTTVSGNTVTGNQYVGLGMTSVCLAYVLQGLPCEGLDIEPNSDGNRITGNLILGNATVPVPGPLDLLRADIAWDRSGIDNCWLGNVHASSVPKLLPRCSR